MKIPAQLPKMAEPKASPPSLVEAPARVGPGEAWEEGYDEHMHELLARRATAKVRVQPKLQTGYGELVARAEGPRLQRKGLTQPGASVQRSSSALLIGRRDDPLEHEADRVADAVLRAPAETGGVNPSAGAFNAGISLQRMPSVQRGDAAGSAPPIVEQALGAGSGQPLGAATEQFFGTRMGYDFSDVRLHTDSLAQQSAKAIGAHAYTAGRDIVFGKPFVPSSAFDQKLLAHELVHIVQQGGELGNTGRGKAIQRQPRQGTPAPQQGTPIRKFGIVYKREGVNLLEQPLPNSPKVSLLAFNTRVFVDSQNGEWYFITTDDGKFGYCSVTHLKINLPEPNATIHWIQESETALGISQQHYGGKAEWGSDHRFYVNGLVYVNQGEGRRGIYKPDANANWETTQVRAGMMIWIPSLSFLKSLRGKVSSKSITREAWESVKSAAQAVADFALGTGAFIAGLLHGALESLWDVLVGLKDLAVMLWDILASLFSGNLLSDASNLWNSLANLDWKKLVQGWIDDFEAKWNAPGLLDRWHFRGWVIGYAIMEVLMLIFSDGIIQGIKWVGKASKVSRVIKNLPRLQKLAETVKGNKAFQKVAKALSKGEAIADTAADAVKWIERLLNKPKMIWGKGPDQIADLFRKAGCEVIIEQSTKGSKLSKQLRIKGHKIIQNIQVHPGGGSKRGSYYKISTSISTKGIIKVVDRATYVAGRGEKATIIFVDEGLKGWMLQAATANAAAQKAGQEIDARMNQEDE